MRAGGARNGDAGPPPEQQDRAALAAPQPLGGCTYGLPASLQSLFLFRFVDPAVCRVWGTAFRATLLGGESVLEFPVSFRFEHQLTLLPAVSDACGLARGSLVRRCRSWGQSSDEFSESSQLRGHLTAQDKEVEWGKFLPLDEALPDPPYEPKYLVFDYIALSAHAPCNERSNA